ncbi:Iron-binding zinc finger CDGSH type [Hoeflea phototrophica DFL-43]|uniref:Iron-binding zinc finger CDGSH type n=1 Tax=Hoeflea phototrophica (strain DSM 17068 / NCIMB 14078 / DFL-43) TaxID=411684 RepID=A9DDN1_HOEPD|nr:CDGSH iron-sulfur domain-containing protein [Hoeflea phototrophica]EDQ32101.1 Iron-binding zinc finger CDGSH type [Hoeflea phototrophica DFL-43]
MTKGQVAATVPVRIEVEADKSYFWCTCGQSSKQPFCDGSHSGTEFQPLKWTAEQSGAKFFCTCKQTDGQPFCDGSHSTVSG